MNLPASSLDDIGLGTLQDLFLCTAWRIELATGGSDNLDIIIIGLFMVVC